MTAYDQLGLLSLVSKSTQKAYMLISVDPELVNENGREFEGSFDMLPDDVMDALRHEGSSVLEFDDLEAAYPTFLAVEEATSSFENIELFSLVYSNGFSMLSINQNNDTPLIPHQFASALAM